MKFDEANKTVDTFDEDLESESWMPDSKVYEIIDKLKATYEPTVFMTNDEIEVFQHYLYGVGSLRELLDYKVAPERLEDGNFSELSEEDLASAWLSPKSVELREEEED